MLPLDLLTFPTLEHIIFQNIHDEVGIALLEPTFPSNEWRQLGDLEGKSIVLQLGFKRLSHDMVPAGLMLLRG